jgi:hypothetical protein
LFEGLLFYLNHKRIPKASSIREITKIDLSGGNYSRPRRNPGLYTTGKMTKQRKHKRAAQQYFCGLDETLAVVGVVTNNKWLG